MHPLPGWNEHVAPYKKDSLFWHSVWVSAGRPASGSLYQVMSHARNKYYLAVKQVKRAAASIKATELANTAEAGDIALMKELKKSLDRKDNSQSVPNCLLTSVDMTSSLTNCLEGGFLLW